MASERQRAVLVGPQDVPTSYDDSPVPHPLHMGVTHSP